MLLPRVSTMVGRLELCEVCFDLLGMDYENLRKLKEKAVDLLTWETVPESEVRRFEAAVDVVVDATIEAAGGRRT